MKKNIRDVNFFKTDAFKPLKLFSEMNFEHSDFEVVLISHVTKQVVKADFFVRPKVFNVLQRQ